MIRLGDIVEVSNGFAFKSSNYVADGVRVVRIANVQKGYISDESPKFYPLDSMDEHNRYLIREGDILMSLTGNVGRVGVFPAELLPAFLNQRVARLRPKSSIDKHYLFHLLNSDEFERKAIWNSSGVAQLNLSSKWVEDYMIELPPLEEQKRIAAILDEADRVRKKTQALIDKYDELAQSLFLDMFGDPVTNPKGWELRPIGEMTEKVAKWNPRKEGGDTSFQYIDLGSVDKDSKRILTEEITLVRAFEAPSRARQLVRSNDILVSTVRPNLNGVAMVPEGFDSVTASTGFCVLRPMNHSWANFLFNWVQTDFFIEEMVKQSTGANYPALSERTIRASKAFTPPFPLLERFNAEVAIFKSLKNAARSQNDLENRLFNALLQKAFKGELT